MSNASDESRSETGSDEQIGIGDDQLPEDLQPSEDNPLAESLGDGERVEGLLDDGNDAEQTEDQADEQTDSGSSDSDDADSSDSDSSDSDDSDEESESD